MYPVDEKSRLRLGLLMMHAVIGPIRQTLYEVTCRRDLGVLTGTSCGSTIFPSVSESRDSPFYVHPGFYFLSTTRHESLCTSWRERSHKVILSYMMLRSSWPITDRNSWVIS